MANDEVVTDQIRSERDLRAYQVIGKSLLERIRSGEFRTTGKLPTERDLAEVYGVGRAVIRDALVMLEVKGLVQSRQGSGIYITRHAYESEGDVVEETPGGDPDRVSPPNPSDLMAAHQWLDSQIARQAASRIDEDGMVAVEKALEALTTSLITEEYNGLNLRFHRAIALAAHNSEFVVMADQMWRRREQSPAFKNLSALLCGERYRAILLADHRRTVSFLHRGDGEGAHYAMWHHYENLKAAMAVSEALPQIRPVNS
ncbi:FadR/GntR family transcriptional regulator [Asticcacaulis sp. AND118]|uniref:FadR/GntR family transcriptional regulator n=1 Tax=Asticcacaulis sp. AND118 TaxID=2840468 RepID=UPI001CFF6E26|nr:GntR family transcriptional regulator [Asticcacaulis sp. AND118]UDF05715.1 GntR family transcriptional regulator [Asticcacaulis sp. AND118]